LIRNLRWQDCADILLLTAIFSWVYSWMRRTIAVQISFGMVTLLVGSWVSNHFGLILTSYLLSAVSAVATMVVVVVFQREIRRGLGRVSPMRWISDWHRRQWPVGPSAVIAEAAFTLAAAGKGALVVIPRGDWVGEYISGGTSIDAHLSSSLIEAVFTSTAPLHDGALLIGNNRVARAGTILPLAAETGDPRHGTRHRAALGLASLSDAVVVCVSEERHTVMVAHDGGLHSIHGEAELREMLDRLCSNRRATKEGSPERSRRAMDALAYLLIFLGVVSAWAAIVSDRSHEVGRVVPLEIRGVSDSLRFDPPRITSIAVQLRSSSRELDLMAPDAVEAYIDVSASSGGSHVFHVHTNAPAGIEVVSAAPSTVSLQIRKRDTDPPAPAKR
ncbi:MAG TPA: diadenylate cyclase, partial [Polyangia bacterium]